jgi:hypothetical protein
MRFINKSYKKHIAVMLCVFTAGLFFYSCEVEEKFELKAFGPSQVVRGGEIYFVGKKLDEVSKIIFSEGSTINKEEFLSVTPEKIVVRIPADYPLHETGKITLELFNGESLQTTSSFMVFSSISFSSVIPAGENNPLKPGDEIAINGINLKAVDAIIFKNGTVHTDFTEQTDNTIKLLLPHAVSGGAISARIPGYDEEGNPVYTLVEGPEIIVIDPAMDKINGENNIEVPPGAELTLTGDYFGSIDIVSGQVTVNFTESSLTASAQIDVAENKLVFTLPLALEQGKEISVIIDANGGDKVTSNATFVIEETSVTGHTTESVWAPRGQIVLTGNNFQAVSRMSLSRSNGEGGELERAVPIVKSADGKTITFTAPSAYGRDGKEIPKLFLYSGDILYYDYFPEE